MLRFLLVLLGLVESYGQINTKPHIIVIIADDLGWNDVGHHGSAQIPTPNIDALGYNGVMFDKHYSIQSCTPSRSAFLTGQYPTRFGYQGFPLRPGEKRELPRNIKTLPASLKKLGYSTHLVGKWHVGYGFRNNSPVSFGYDTHYGYWNGFVGYFQHLVRDSELSGFDFYEDQVPLLETNGLYVTDLLTNRSLQIIENHDVQKPMHLVISHLAAHTGLSVEDLVGQMEVANQTEVDQKYSYINNQIRRNFADIVQRMDDSVGKVVHKLKERNMLQNSIIVFFSDNGAMSEGMFTNHGSNWPLRGMKLTLFEGGVRVPAVLYSPSLINKGRVFKNLMHITDWMPTLYSAAGGDVKNLGDIDGKDQWTNIKNNLNLPIRNEFLVNIDEYYQFSAFTGFNGRYKYLNNSFLGNVFDLMSGDQGIAPTAFYDQGVLSSDANQAIGHGLTNAKIRLLQKQAQIPNCRKNTAPVICTGVCLFDLKLDPCETTNVASLHPVVTKVLQEKLARELRRLVPQQNTPFDPKASPYLCNGTWFNWLEEDGCYFASH